jgi:hypothetical protein
MTLFWRKGAQKSRKPKQSSPQGVQAEPVESRKGGWVGPKIEKLKGQDMDRGQLTHAYSQTVRSRFDEVARLPARHHVAARAPETPQWVSQ